MSEIINCWPKVLLFGDSITQVILTWVNDWEPWRVFITCLTNFFANFHRNRLMNKVVGRHCWPVLCKGTFPSLSVT